MTFTSFATGRDAVGPSGIVTTVPPPVTTQSFPTTAPPSHRWSGPPTNASVELAGSHPGSGLEWAQPVAGSQLSVVHGFPSRHVGGGPPTQIPALQVSPTVHTS